MTPLLSTLFLGLLPPPYEVAKKLKGKADADGKHEGMNCVSIFTSVANIVLEKYIMDAFIM